jgi:hypothetical protein
MLMPVQLLALPRGKAHPAVSGRKLTAGSALYSRSGVLQGFSRQTWIEVAAAGEPR